MKRLKLIPSVLMLVLCVGILAIGVYAASPITGTINGTINITAASGVKIAVYRGTSTAAADLIDSAFGSSEVELAAGGATLDASSATSPEEVAAQIYTVVLSTNQATNYVVDTETIQVVDGVGVTSGEKVSGAAIITKLHKPYVANDTVTTDTNGNACFTKDKPYTIQISIKCGKLSTEAISVSYNIDMAIYTESEYTGTGVNGVDYLYFGEYPQTKSAETTGFTATGEMFKAYSDAATKTSEIETERAVYKKDNKRYVGMEVDSVMGYYEIQPLKWRILSTTNGYSLMCDTVIEQVYYQQFRSGNYAIIDGETSSTIYANNYYYSTLRKFMNETFYASAFSDAERALIQKTMVKNDDASMGGTDKKGYSCENLECNDYIFALSYEEALMSDYGFATSSGSSDTRKIASSDYAKDTGVYTNNGSSSWWLRSPFADDAFMAYFVYYNGNVSFNNVNNYSPGCVPSLLLGL